MRVVIGALMVAVLAGCHPPPSDYEVCSSYGAAGDGLWKCMGQRQEQRAQAAMFLLSRQPQPYAVPYTPISVPFRPSVNTTCMPMGGGMYSCNSN